MSNLTAIILDGSDLSQREKSANNGSTDGTYIYVNGNRVTVSNPHFQLSRVSQRAILEHFLSDIAFKIEEK